MRTLRLASPAMRGIDISLVQRALRVKIDGVYGPATGAAVRAWKYRAGYRREAINDGLAAPGQRLLLGTDPLPDDMRERAQRRLAAGYRPGWGQAIITPTQVRDQALAVMRDWVGRGLVESPAGSNRVPYLAEIAEREEVSDAIDEMGYAWCAFTVMLANLVAGGQTGELALIRGAFNGLYCPTILDLARARRYGMQTITRDQARAGDWVLFDFGEGLPQHIGTLTTSVPAGGPFGSIEGNTSAGPGGSQDNGGGLYHRTDRTTATARWFVRAS